MGKKKLSFSNSVFSEISCSSIPEPFNTDKIVFISNNNHAGMADACCSVDKLGRGADKLAQYLMWGGTDSIEIFGIN